MKIVVDEKKLARNARIARGLVLGVVVVAIGMMIAVLLASTSPLLRTVNPSTILLVEVVVIVLLFLVSRIGFIYANRYLAFNRPEKVLRDNLKGLDRKYALMLFQKPVDYLLIEPGGITVIVPRGQDGRISYKGGKWKYNRSILRAWMGRDEALGDPTDEASEAMALVKKTLAAQDPDLHMPIRAVVVFTHPKVQLDVEPSPIAVIRAEEIKDYLRAAGKLNDLPKSVQRRMRAALGAPDLSADSGQ